PAACRPTGQAAASTGLAARGAKGVPRTFAASLLETREPRHALGVGEDAAQQADFALVQAAAQEQAAQLAHGRLRCPALVEVDRIQGSSQLSEHSLRSEERR